MPLKRADIYLLIFLLLVSLLGIVHPYLRTENSALAVHINLAGREETFPLRKEQMRLIKTPHGEVKLYLTPHSVCVLASPCRDKLCMRAGAITQAGQSIVCLPQRLVITLTSTSKEVQIDGTTY